MSNLHPYVYALFKCEELCRNYEQHKKVFAYMSCYKPVIFCGVPM